MLPESGGPRSRTPGRASGCRPWSSALNASERCPRAGVGASAGLVAENQLTFGSRVRRWLRLRRSRERRTPRSPRRRPSCCRRRTPRAGWTTPGGPCRPAPPSRPLPRKRQPSSSPTRGAVRLPSIVAVLRITICSPATRLPCTSPATLTNFAWMSAFTRPLWPIVTLCLGSTILPSILPRIVRSSSPLTSPTILIEAPIPAASWRSGTRRRRRRGLYGLRSAGKGRRDRTDDLFVTLVPHETCSRDRTRSLSTGMTQSRTPAHASMCAASPNQSTPCARTLARLACLRRSRSRGGPPARATVSAAAASTSSKQTALVPTCSSSARSRR